MGGMKQNGDGFSHVDQNSMSFKIYELKFSSGIEYLLIAVDCGQLKPQEVEERARRQGSARFRVDLVKLLEGFDLRKPQP